jgi:hypothetical protein
MIFIRGVSLALLLTLILCSTVRAQPTITIGETAVLTAADSGNGNLLVAQSAALAQTATIDSLSFYVTKAAGSLRMGIYDSTGPGGGPGKLKAQTNSFTPVTGWNTASVVTPVSLPAGTYWLAYLPSSNTLAFRKENNTGVCAYYSFKYAAMPATFSTSPNSCTPTNWSFYATLTPSTTTAVNGVCGSSNGADLTSAPAANLCSAGTASTVSGSGPWTWSCAGSNGGTTASCSAQLKINGACGSANGVAVSAAPSSNLCTTGLASVVSGSGPWAWSCAGSNGGTTASCSAPLAASQVNGVCGSANGVAVSSAPTTNLCSAGTTSAVTGTGPWTWTCAGSNDGTTASCSAPLQSTGVNGQCGPMNGVYTNVAPTSGLCSAGTATAVSGTGPWTWSCDGSNGGTNASCEAFVVGGGPLPVLIQHVASSSNPFPGNGIPGNNFKIPLPNPVLAGDALVLAISYPNGSTPTIMDNLGNTWPSAATCTANNGSGNMIASIYVLPNSNGGTVSGPGTITVGFGKAVQPFQYTISEFNNIATSSPVDGCEGTPGIAPNSSALIDPGSFTPTANNGSGGNLIWNYTAVAQTDVGAPSTWTAATGFTLLDGDILETYPGFPHASQWYVQPAQAAVDPSITSTGDTADRFNSVTVALKVASAGGTMPSGIHINKVLHFTSGSFGGTWTMQAPVTGNLRVIESATPNATWTVTDNDSGSSWTVEQGSSNPQVAMAFAGNRGAMSTYQFTLHLNGSSPQTSLRFYDIQGAAASPFDVAVNAPANSSCTTPSVANSPRITPTTTNGLTIAGMPFGQGPGTGASAPANAVFDLVNYSGETDIDTMENADAAGHFYNTDTSAESWTWLFGSVSNGSCGGAEAIHFNGASTITGNNGACGPANGTDVASAPTTNLCSAGTASAVTGTGPFDWTCAGGSGGTTASCSANLLANGSCGSANGVAVSSAPTVNLCSAGTASAVTGSGPWNWTCAGSNGGSTASCSAPLTSSAVNGVCGSMNGVYTSTAPTTNLCSTGMATAVSGSGPWTWSCDGTNGGTNASCEAFVGNDPTVAVLPSYNDVYTNWANAGLQSVGGIPNRTTVCATVNPLGGGQDDFTDIQNAINKCPAGEVVQLGAGAFTVHTADLPIQLSTGISLRGAGSCSGSSSPYCQTSINVSDGILAYTGGMCGTSTSDEAACPNGGPAVIVIAPVAPDYNYSWAKCGNIGGALGTGCGATPLATDAAQGQSTIQVTSTSNFSAGQWVLVDEASGAGWVADPLNAVTGFGSVWAASDWVSSSGSPATGRVMWSKSENGGGWDFGSTYPYQANSTGCWHSYCDRPTAELHKIASIGAGPCPGAGCTLTFDDPLTIAFRQSGSHNAQVYGGLYSNQSGAGSPISFLQNAGVENLSVLRGPNGGIEMEFCAYCWLKNTEIGDWYNGGVSIEYSARSELNTVYVHHCWDSVNSGGEYPIALDAASTEILITNSITNFGGKGMVARAGGAGSVVSYNYVDDTMYDEDSGIGDYWVDMGVNASHYSGPHHVLFEGNWGDNLDNDNTHGNSMYMTFFRNQGTGLRSPFTDPSIDKAVDDFTGVGWACPSGASSCFANAPGVLRAAGPMAYNYWFAFVGNVLGLAGETTAANGWSYQGDWNGKRMFMLGWNAGLPGAQQQGGEDPYLDGVSGSYIWRNGDYDYVNGSIVDWASSSHTLPNSFYLSSAPAFFSAGTSCTYAWPWVTPTGSTPIQSNSCGGPGLPAKARYDAGTPFTQP